MSSDSACSVKHWFLVILFLIVFVGTWTFYNIRQPERTDWNAEAQQEMIPEVTPTTSRNETLILEIDRHILHKPPWVDTRSWGLRTAKDLQAPPPPNQGGMDHEEEFAWTKFFKGTTNGLVLELGAMDGKSYSVSKFFEMAAGWKAILIEASPQALQIPRNRPNALSLQLAVCQAKSTIHYVNAADVGGILEFMNAQFVTAFHRDLLRTESGGQGSLMDKLDWDKVRTSSKVTQLTCLPLQAVFDRFGVDHIDFMILDLEGGELASLKSLDFDRIRIDVLSVETNRFNNPADPYIDQVVNYMVGKRYKVLQRTNGRNTWFVFPIIQVN